MTEPPTAHRDLTLDDALAHPFVREDLARAQIAPEAVRRWLNDTSEPERMTEPVLARMMMRHALVTRIGTNIPLNDPIWAAHDDGESR
jgi:hypothetical protein